MNEYLSIMNNYLYIPNFVEKLYCVDKKNETTLIRSCFTIYYIYYVITIYIVKPNLPLKSIKKTFLLWIEKCNDSYRDSDGDGGGDDDDGDKNKLHNILKFLIINHEYFYDVFFIKENIYFSTHFNNLSKYFLPLPHKYNSWSPIIIYNDNINGNGNSNGNNDIFNTVYSDNFEMETEFDILLKPKKMDDEININISIKYFDHKQFLNKDVIYLCADENKLYICENNFNIVAERKNNFNKNVRSNIEKYKNKVPFEYIFPLWNLVDKNETIKVSNLKYIAVLKRITSDDLFNVFCKIDFLKQDYKYLYHNTFDNANLSKSLYFYFVPFSKSRYFEREKKRRCATFKIKKDILNILDLTSSVMTCNPFSKPFYKKDFKDGKFVSFDTNDYNKTKFHKNYKCIDASTTIYNKNSFTNNSLKYGTNIGIGDNIRSNAHIYCDIYDYTGKDRLKEILFKTRIYSNKNIWLCNKSISYKTENSIYRPQKLTEPKIDLQQSNDFEKYIMKDLNINGYFFTDYSDAINGGEILIINPNEYIKLYKLSNKPCYNL